MKLNKLFLFFFMASIVYAQQIKTVIGTGTSLSVFPFMTMSEDVKSDIIYKADEIYASGGVAGKIIQIGFNVAYRAANLHTMSGFTIKMKHTNLDSLSNINDGDWVIVYSTSLLDITNTGWLYFNLDQPFYWNGVDNILLESCFNNPDGFYLTNSKVYSTTMSNLMVSAKYYDRTDGCALTSSFPYGESDYERPNLSLTIDIEGNPLIPVLANPSNGTKGLTATPTLNWNIALNATFYCVQIARDSTFNNLVYNNQNITATTIHVISSLNNNTVYYWRVNAMNSTDTSRWSQVWNFKTLDNPSQPIIIYPANNTINIPVNVIFVWNKSQDQLSKAQSVISQLNQHKLIKDHIWGIKSKTNISQYWFELSSDTTSSCLIAKDTTLTDTTKLVTGLQYFTGYWWRVRAMNEVGWGVYTNWSGFTTIIDTPATPYLIAPSNGIANQPVSLTLTWNIISEATSYRLLVATDSLFTSPVVNDSTLTTAGKLVSGLFYGTKYYWKVNAKNIGGTSRYSETWSFITSGSNFPKPIPVTPTCGKLSVTLPVELNWVDNSHTAVSYQLKLSDDINFNTCIIDSAGLTTPQFVIISGLSGLKWYFWKVISSNLQSQPGEWSDICNFKTDPMDGVNSDAQAPAINKLDQNYPNPFNPTTTIHYQLSKTAKVEIFIFNTNGMKVKTLINENKTSGNYSIIWDGTNNDNKAVSSGVYFYQIRLNDFLQTRKMIFIK